MTLKKDTESRHNHEGLPKDRSFLKKPIREWTVGHYLSILTAMGFGGGATNADSFLKFFEPEFTKEDRVLLIDNAKANKQFREEAKAMLKDYKDADINFTELGKHLVNKDEHMPYEKKVELFVTRRNYAEDKREINEKLDMLIQRAMTE